MIPIPAARLSLGVSGEPLAMGEIITKNKLLDITDDLNARVFPPIPRGSSVAKSSVCIVGGQGSGKSILLSYLYWVAIAIYGLENIHCIYTDDIRVALDLLDDKPVQLVIIDDAMTYASSREVYKQTDIIKTYNRSRHVYEERLNGKPGVIIYLWAWQRFGELDPAFRQGDAVIFKTGIAEPTEKRLISQFIGPWYSKVLWQIWDKMNRGNNAIKSISVARISSLEGSRSTGIYRAEVPDISLPPIVRSEDHFRDDRTEDEILDAQRNKPGWGKKIECYLMARDEDMTQEEIAEKLGVSQGFVSKSQQSVRKLLEKK